MREYKATVKEISKEVTTKEKIMLKDTSNAVSLDKASADAAFNNEPFTIDVDYYAILDVHNEKSDDKDYEQYIIVAKDGTKYVTGSTSFFNAFIDIYDEMNEAGEGDNITIEVYRKESKNYSGKEFITCSLI